ncbi:hypothetical protein ACFSQ7_49215 [Paenibacillus rhizoplanae]
MKGGRAFPAAAPFAAFFRYLLIIVAALLFVPVVIPLTIAIYSIFGGLTHTSPPKEYKQYSSVDKLEIMWHEEARKLLDQPPADITRRLSALSEAYPLSRIFWVDPAGKNTAGDRAFRTSAALDGRGSGCSRPVERR